MFLIASLFFGFFVYLKDRKNKLNQLFGLVCLFGASWGLAAWRIGIMPEEKKELALLSWRIAYVGIIFIPIVFYHFVYAWLKLEKRIVLYLFYIFGLFFSVLMWTPWADLFYGLKNMKFFFNSFYLVYPPTPVFSFFVLMWFVIIVYAHYELYKALKKASGTRYIQIKYFILAFAMAFAGGGSTFLSCLGITVYPYLNLLCPLYPAVLAYAVIRYRFMNIYWVLGKIGIYVLSFFTILLYIMGFSFISQKVFTFSPIISNILIGITTVFVFHYSFLFYRKIASKHFYYTFYALQQTIKELGKNINQTIELSKIVNLVNRSLLDALKLDRVGVILKKHKDKNPSFYGLIKFKEEEITVLLNKEEKFLIKYIEQTKKPIVKEEIAFAIEKLKRAKTVSPLVAKESIQKRVERLGKLKTDMGRKGIGLFFPLFVGQELTGILILGDKLSSEAYTVQDIELLDTLSAQAAVAFNNALSYEEINQRKAELERFYKLTVGRELKMAELKKENKKLEERIRERK